MLLVLFFGFIYFSVVCLLLVVNIVVIRVAPIIVIVVLIIVVVVVVIYAVGWLSTLPNKRKSACRPFVCNTSARKCLRLSAGKYATILLLLLCCCGI